MPALVGTLLTVDLVLLCPTIVIWRILLEKRATTENPSRGLCLGFWLSTVGAILFASGAFILTRFID
jgi:hypothetical protein